MALKSGGADPSPSPSTDIEGRQSNVGSAQGGISCRWKIGRAVKPSDERHGKS